MTKFPNSKERTSDVEWDWDVFSIFVDDLKEVFMSLKNSFKWLKRFLFIALLVCSHTITKAQDLIVKQDGETIKAYRTDVGNNAVYYRVEDTEEASIMAIDKSDVLFIKLQNGAKMIIDEVGSTTVVKNEVVREDYVPCFPEEPVADPDMIAKAEIGSLIDFYDGSKGVVFYLDGNGHGLAVYLYEDKSLMNWQSAASWRDCVDIKTIPNERNTEIQMGLGSVYSDAAIRQLGLEEVPAIKWCRSIGQDWYLPSLGELYELLVVANLSKGGFGPINKALKDAGGNKMLGELYFSSSEEDNTNVFAVHKTDGVAVAKKYVRHSCRAVRLF